MAWLEWVDMVRWAAPQASPDAVAPAGRGERIPGSGDAAAV